MAYISLLDILGKYILATIMVSNRELKYISGIKQYTLIWLMSLQNIADLEWTLWILAILFHASVVRSGSARQLC